MQLPTTQRLLTYLGKRRAQMIEDISREDGVDQLFDIMLKPGWQNSEGETIVIVNLACFETVDEYLKCIRYEFDRM